jgi:retron-type reverse transcriptase
MIITRDFKKGKGKRRKVKGERGKVKGERGKVKGERVNDSPLPLK